MAKFVTLPEDLGPFLMGTPNTEYARYFSGESFLNILNTEGALIANVTFEPGCRNNWHIHHAKKGGGQILLCTAGKGWLQFEGEEPILLLPGKSAYIPPEKKHWHGAADDSWFAHLAVEVPGEGISTEWLGRAPEKVER